jgi:hypothetical protein
MWPGGEDMDAWLGVKGSPVQIRPSRRVFERLYPGLGTKIAQVGTITVAAWALPGIAPKVVQRADRWEVGGVARRYSMWAESRTGRTSTAVTWESRMRVSRMRDLV